MLFIPYERLTIMTGLSVNETAATLAEIVEPKRWWRNPFSRNHKRYQGQVTPASFELMRIIHHRNSFLPVIKGQLQPAVRGTLVQLTLSLHPLVLVFWLLWLSMIGLGALAGLASWLTTRGELVKLIPVGMFVFGYLLCIIAFNWEARKERQFIAELLSGQRVP
jgi:hypothetical protein